MMKIHTKSNVRTPKGTELVVLSKITDFALMAYLVHPNYTTNLPVKLHSLMFNTLEGMTDAPAGTVGWRKFADSSVDTLKDMGILARIMLENVKVSSFLSIKVR